MQLSSNAGSALRESHATGHSARRARALAVARALAALCLAAVPAVAGVLPEDRADVLYHRYQGGGITVQGPSILVQKRIGDHFAVNANYYQDMISSASIDVLLSASPYKETRTQKSVGAEYLHGKTTYSAGFINSVEPDYKANTAYYSVSQDMFGDLTTVTLSYSRGWDQIYRDIKVNGVIVNDPTFHQRADHRVYGLSISQILTRSLVGTFNYQFSTDQGYLASPYREIRFIDPNNPVGYSLAPQIYPTTRTMDALSASLKYYFPYRAALTGKYRFFTDSWGIVAHTLQLDYLQPVRHHWTLDGSVRYYRQGAASFYSDIFPYADYSNFMARDRELAAFHSITLGLEASYAFSIPHATWIQKSTATLSFNRMMVNYLDYRDALYSKFDPSVIKGGEEPLYTLDASIYQAYVSLWF
ncbi:MAG TPA: DUF3570 domain-containing protein [Steroidobacteraceae bacterium]|nr:DUF3570 domain-containing protein [Steroidobacteraceae bacterium]